MVSRMGLSILRSVGCESLAVSSFAAYENKVVELYTTKGAATSYKELAPWEAVRLQEAMAQWGEPSPMFKLDHVLPLRIEGRVA
jgi:hypothetical protein